MASPPLENARKVARLSAELLRYRRATAPAIAAKAVLARSVWGIDVTRFLMVGMYDQSMSRWRDSMGYLVDLEPGLRTINWQGDGKTLTVDKLITAERCLQKGIPAAPLIAVIGRNREAHPHQGLFPQLSSAREISSILAECPDQLFVKPATGWRGDGIFGAERSGSKWKVGAETLSADALTSRLLAAAPPSGLLLQGRVRSHRALAPIGGTLGLGCVRINTALTVDGPELLFTFAKIMGSECLVDNFAGGKFGNMLARVDNDSGILAAVFGRERDQRYLMEPVSHHPVTGTPLLGFQLPLWPEAVALAKRTASAFPEAPLIGSDIAITDDGPLIIEVQSDWDSNAPQLIMETGLRPVLRNLIPRLALSEAVKQRAFEQMGLGSQPRRSRKLERAARI
ncbi:MAG: sugar-transfer associated ATP-grasp domain-containing protein [Steroidobacteraceae bacterium]